MCGVCLESAASQLFAMSRFLEHAIDVRLHRSSSASLPRNAGIHRPPTTDEGSSRVPMGTARFAVLRHVASVGNQYSIEIAERSTYF